MTKTTSALTFAVFAAATLLLPSAVTAAECMCTNKGLQGCTEIEPTHYPGYEEMGFTGGCLPSVPEKYIHNYISRRTSYIYILYRLYILGEC